MQSVLSIQKLSQRSTVAAWSRIVQMVVMKRALCSAQPRYIHAASCGLHSSFKVKTLHDRLPQQRCMSTQMSSERGYSEGTVQILNALGIYANKVSAPQIESEILLRCLLDSSLTSDRRAEKILRECGIDPQKSLIPKLDQFIAEQQKSQSSKGTSQPQLGNSLQEVLREADRLREKWNHNLLIPLHLLGGLVLQDRRFLIPFLRTAGIDAESIIRRIAASLSVGASKESVSRTYEDTLLSQFGKNLTHLAATGKLDPVVGRDESIKRVIQILCRRTKNNPVIIGEPGVGKTALAEGLAQKIIADDVPDALKGKQIITLDLVSLVAGAKYRGDYEQRLQTILQEIQALNNVILFIDELHMVIGGAGSDSAMDAGNIMKPALARGDLRCIGCTTIAEYRRFIEKDKALERRFQRIYLQEPSVEETISILRGLRDKYEAHHGIRLQDATLTAAAKLSDRFIGDRFLPDKAIDLIDEAASRARIQATSRPEKLDQLEQRLNQAKMEQYSLKKDRLSSSKEKERLKLVEEEIRTVQEDFDKLNAEWKKEIGIIKKLHELKAQKDQLRVEQENAQRAQNLTRASQIKYGDIPDIEKKIADLEEQQKSMKSFAVTSKNEVTPEDIAKVVTQWTSIPVERLIEEEREKLLSLKSNLLNSVIGQDHAVEAVVAAVERSKMQLNDPNRPLASFLFLGPTGVGKTELCRALAANLFSTSNHLIRVDMSEYAERHTISRLIGAPPGYVGFDSHQGQLSEAIRRCPHSVVLFDELEKAHPDIMHLLLQTLEDGRLTDSKGNLLSFRDAIIIFTSNIGSHLYEPNATRSTAELHQKVLDHVKATLKPEFFNRLDSTIIFNSLSKSHVLQIVDLELTKVIHNVIYSKAFFFQLNKRLAARQEQAIALRFAPEVKEALAEVSYSPEFGARPIKRALQQYIETPLASYLIRNNTKTTTQELVMNVSLSPESSDQLKVIFEPIEVH